MLAGPSVVNCFNAEGGMGQCLRGEMVQAGILPQPAVADVGPATSAGAPVIPAGEEQPAQLVEPALDVAEPATPVPDTATAATFGLLRAEPDGSVVIAGSGAPGSEVEIYANEDLLGTTLVGPSGDWVFVPGTPLSPGELEITLGEAGKPGRAEDSFIVAINEDKSSEPLVVVSKPGAPTEVLQGLDEPEPDEQLASVDPVVPPAETAPPADAPPVPETPAEPAAPSSAPASVPEPVPPLTPAAPQTAEVAPSAVPAIAAAPLEPSTGAAPQATVQPQPEPSPAPAEAPAAPPAQTPPPAETPAVPAPTVAETTPDAPAQTQPATAAPQPEQSATPEPTPTPVDPAPVQPALDDTPPTIDAIEIEGDQTYFAGAGPEGGDIRLYVDDVFVADAKVSDGRWLIEAGPVLKQSSQRVRIDLLQPGSSKVASRAEVNFVVELPGERPLAIAQAESPTPTPAPEPTPAAPETTVAQPSPSPASEPQVGPTPAVPAPAPASPEPVAPTPAPSAPAAPSPAAATEDPAPATEPVPASPAQTTEPAPDQPAQAAQSAPEPASTPAVDPAPATDPAPVPEPTPPVEPAPAAEAAPATEPVPAAPAEAALMPATTDTEPDVPTMVAVSVGDPDAERFASGKAIIRRGDNLWTIARRVYGQGVKYTTIYEANTGQIRDPDRIYPGQVFALPEN